MNYVINKMSGFIFGTSVPKAVRFFWSDNKGTFMLMAAVVISLTVAGCNISGSDMNSEPNDAGTILSAQGSMSSIIGPSDNCPVVTGQDVDGGGPHVINFLLRKAEGLLLPATHAVSGHFQIKICRTLTENYQFEWNLRINNKDGLGYTGWALVNADTEEELLGEQFSSKIASGRVVHQNGILEIDPELVVGPPDLKIVVTTTDPTQILIGLLLPAVQAGK